MVLQDSAFGFDVPSAWCPLVCHGQDCHVTVLHCWLKVNFLWTLETPWLLLFLLDHMKTSEPPPKLAFVCPTREEGGPLGDLKYFEGAPASGAPLSPAAKAPRLIEAGVCPGSCAFAMTVSKASRMEAAGVGFSSKRREKLVYFSHLLHSLAHCVHGLQTTESVERSPPRRRVRSCRKSAKAASRCLPVRELAIPHP